MRSICYGLLIALAPMGCSTWHPVGPTPAQSGVLTGGRRIRVTQAAGGPIDLRLTRLACDTLFGQTDGGDIAIPIAEVRRIEVREADGGRTAWLVVGVLGVAFLGLAAMAAAAPIPP